MLVFMHSSSVYAFSLEIGWMDDTLERSGSLLICYKSPSGYVNEGQKINGKDNKAFSYAQNWFQSVALGEANF